MEVLINKKYVANLEKYSRTKDFLKDQEIIAVEKLDSLWRKENLILKLNCIQSDYVFKKVGSEKELSELKKVRVMRNSYPKFVPKIFIIEQDSYLMEYIDGYSFFNLEKNEKVEKISFAGKNLKEMYSEKNKELKDISQEVKESFEKYRGKRKRFFKDNELRLSEDYFNIFKEVPNQTSHNDLNAANLLYLRAPAQKTFIKLIDPSEEGFNDISRDVGRYCASCFFNNYDYFGNDKKHSLEIVEAFITNFDEATLFRAKYFIGESFLSFLNFDTVSVPKTTLKKLTLTTLLNEDKIINLLEEGLK